MAPLWQRAPAIFWQTRPPPLPILKNPGKAQAMAALQCTEVRFASFLSGEFTTKAVINPPEKKEAKRTSVQWHTFVVSQPDDLNFAAETIWPRCDFKRAMASLCPSLTKTSKCDFKMYLAQLWLTFAVSQPDDSNFQRCAAEIFQHFSKIYNLKKNTVNLKISMKMAIVALKKKSFGPIVAHFCGLLTG